VESNRDIAIGTEVLVTLPGLPSQTGVIRWKDGRCYGITFNRLLALAKLVEWLQQERDLLRAAG